MKKIQITWRTITEVESFDKDLFDVIPAFLLEFRLFERLLYRTIGCEIDDATFNYIDKKWGIER